MLAVTDVVKRYREHAALDGVTLGAEAGTVTALLGPNGAGKSTLVSLCAGLSRPDAGAVRVDGIDPSARSGTRGLVGVAPQEIGVYPQLTVDANLRFFGELHGLDARAARMRAGELLEPFALAELPRRRAGQLSGGEQRRLHAAIAVVDRPKVVLFDEPTAGADPSTRDHILRAVLAQAAEGAAVLYTTHYLPEVSQLDATVVLLERGQVIAQGRTEALIAAHARPSLVLELAGGGEPPAAVVALDGAVVDGRTVTVPAADPGATLRRLLADLGPEGDRLTGVEIVRPSLETAYVALTGRRTADVETEPA